MKATAGDLRSRTREILAAVMRGEEVVITFRGRPSARMVPIGARREEGRETGRDLFGMWSDNEATANVKEHVAGLRRGRYA